MPSLTANQLRESIKRAGSLYYAPNYDLGYGIPDFNRAHVIVELLDNKNVQVQISPNLIRDRNPELYANSAHIDSIVDVKIFNINGILVGEFSQEIYPGKNVIPFDFTSLVKGWYYVKIFTRKTVFSHKVIIH
jgi:hypothetical protein